MYKLCKYILSLHVGLVVHTANKLVVSFSDCGSAPTGLRVGPCRLALLVTFVKTEAFVDLFARLFRLSSYLR